MESKKSGKLCYVGNPAVMASVEYNLQTKADKMQEEEEELILNAIDKEFKKYLSNPENLENSANTIVDDLIDDAILSVVFELDITRKAKIPEHFVGDNGTDTYKILDSDIFGQGSGKKGSDCTCPCCERQVGPGAFAPHLAKCMGLGTRTSRRIARGRIANNANKETGNEEGGGGMSDDDGDADWTDKASEKRGKRKKERNTNKKLKSSKVTKNGNSGSDGSNTSSTHISYENMSERDRKALLSQICGVISEHTGKVCTKSPKCPQHTEEQKKIVRVMYISDMVDKYFDSLQIDVEDDGETGKDSLACSWEAENSNTSSPADSASTSSSSSKKTR